MSISLLCTFVQEKELQQTLDIIQDRYQLVYNYIYVLNNADTISELYVTYNIDTSYGNHLSVDDTILIHRKKESNTLYTINALNMLISESNNGRLDKSFIIDWSKYTNSMVLTKMDSTRIIKTEIFKVIKLSSN